MCACRCGSGGERARILPIVRPSPRLPPVSPSPPGTCRAQLYCRFFFFGWIFLPFVFILHSSRPSLLHLQEPVDLSVCPAVELVYLSWDPQGPVDLSSTAGHILLVFATPPLFFICMSSDVSLSRSAILQVILIPLLICIYTLHTHTYTHTHIHIHTHAHTHTHTHTHTHPLEAPIESRLYICMTVWMCVCMYVWRLYLSSFALLY